jgi:uncharacterized membrane protein
LKKPRKAWFNRHAFLFKGTFMKFIIVIALSALTFSSFASDLETTVARIEAKRGVACTHLRDSRVTKCFGMPQTCFFSAYYACAGTESFSLRVKLREFNGTIAVRGTIISN